MKNQHDNSALSHFVAMCQIVVRDTSKAAKELLAGVDEFLQAKRHLVVVVCALWLYLLTTILLDRVFPVPVICR